MIYPKSDKQRKFSVASVIERMVVKDFYKERADFQINEITAINSSDQHDVILLSAGTEFVTEIKIRSCKMETYSDNWIELQKLMPLYVEGQKQNKQTWFILSFKDGISIWSVNDIYKRMINGSALIEYRTYGANSVTDNPDQTTKPCLMLKREWATVYKMERKPDIYLKEEAEKWYQEHENDELIYQNWKNPKLK